MKRQPVHHIEVQREGRGDVELVYKGRQTHGFIHGKFHNYVIANHKNPSDIAYLVKELMGPLPGLIKQMPTINKLKKEWGIDPKSSGMSLLNTKRALLINYRNYWVRIENVC